MDKQVVHNMLMASLEDKSEMLKNAMFEIRESTATESKSTAGDKHETARAMAQLEQEKIASQIAELDKIKSFLLQLKPEINCTRVVPGSLIETTQGWYYISVGFGSFQVENKRVFTLNIQAPLGRVFSGKQQGDEVTWNGQLIKIIHIY